MLLPLQLLIKYSHSAIAFIDFLQHLNSNYIAVDIIYYLFRFYIGTQIAINRYSIEITCVPIAYCVCAVKLVQSKHKPSEQIYIYIIRYYSAMRPILIYLSDPPWTVWPPIVNYSISQWCTHVNSEYNSIKSCCV